MTQLVAPEPCADCDRNPAAGYAAIGTTDPKTGISGTKWYCHEDGVEPTCYQLTMREHVLQRNRLLSTIAYNRRLG